MDRVEFLNRLSDQLRHLPAPEVERLRNYYDEMIQDRIEDGMSEEDAVETVGSIEEAVKSAMYETSIPTLMKVRLKESKEKSPNKVLWMVLLILGAPIWLPLVLVFLSVCLVLYCTIWILVMAAYLTELSLALAAITGFISAAVHLLRLSVPTALCTLGLGLVSAAVAMYLFHPLTRLAKTLMRGTVLFVKRIKTLFIRKEVAL